MTQVLACRLDELPVGAARRFDVSGEALCLVRTETAVHALDDICPHADVSLSDGEVDGSTIECWLHGSRFDLHTGAAYGPPATTPVTVYPVIIDADRVLVDLP
jgi:3-phenylpropionate/trans-cinnamate dioxygenase ferredoxin subunit